MNKMRNNLLSASLLLAAMTTLHGCSADETIPAPADDAIGISLTVNEGMPVSRADDAATSSSYTPVGGNVVLYYHSVGSANHTTYTCDGTSWQSASPFYWGSLPMGDEATFFAVAPSAPGSIHSVPADQGDEDRLAAADLLVGSATVARGTQTIPFSLSHQLALVEVRLLNETTDDATAGDITAGDITAAVVTMDGLLTDYSAVGTTAGYTIASRGEVANGLKAFAVDATTHHFIAPAQTVTSLKFSIEASHAEFSKRYSYSGNAELKSGMKTVFSITLREGKAIGISVELADWTDKAGSGTSTPEFPNP